MPIIRLQVDSLSGSRLQRKWLHRRFILDDLEPDNSVGIAATVIPAQISISSGSRLLISGVALHHDDAEADVFATFPAAVMP